MNQFYFFQHKRKAIYVRLPDHDKFIAFLYAVRNISEINSYEDGNYTIDGSLCTIMSMNRVNQSNLLEFVVNV